MLCYNYSEPVPTWSFPKVGVLFSPCPLPYLQGSYTGICFHDSLQILLSFVSHFLVHLHSTKYLTPFTPKLKQSCLLKQS